MLILVTAFEPFGKDPINASWEAAQLLPDTVEAPDGTSVNVVVHQLPVSFLRAGEQVVTLIDRLRPDAVVLMGVAGNRGQVSVESVAVNQQVGRMPDNDGDAPASREVAYRQPEVLNATVPATLLVAALRSAGVPAYESRDAGLYVCNSTFYSALLEAQHMSTQEGLWPLVTFVHVPKVDVMDPHLVAHGMVELLTRVAGECAQADRSSVQVSQGKSSVTLLRHPALSRIRATRVGVTGGIGAGKTTVTHVLGAAGVVADADAIAREVVQPGTPGLAAVVDAFGEQVLDDDGALNRAHMAELVFADPQARTRLEQITHPLIQQRAQQILAQAGVGELAIYDLPLLVEMRAASAFDVVVTVDLPEDQRVRRLILRGLTEQQARARMASQTSVEERRAVSHVWVDNQGSQRETELVVREAMHRWLGVPRNYPDVGGRAS